MSWLTLGLGYALLYAIGGRLVVDHPLARAWYGSIGVAIPAVAVVVLIVRRRRDWLGCQWLFWKTIGVGFVLWLIGHFGWSTPQLLGPQVPPVWLSWHTVFSLCGGVAPLLALLARPHLGARHGALAMAAVDIAGFALLTGFAYAYFIIVPGFDPAHEDAARRWMLLLIQIQRFALFAAVAAAAIVTRGLAWNIVYKRLAMGYGLGFVIRGVLSLAILRGDYHPGSLYDLAWLVPFFFTLSAIAEAPASEADTATLAAPSNPWLVAAALALVPLVGYAGYYLFPLGSTADDFRVLLTTLTVIGGLAVLTARAIVQRAELRRADARQQLLAAVAMQTGDLVLVFDREWRVREANDAAVATFGYGREELAHLRCPDLTAAEGHDAGREAARAMLATETWRGTMVRRRKDGSTFPASCTIGGLRDEAGKVTHFVAVERDITDDLRLRDQVISSERLSAVGEVVAGVAHEINNPLQAIIGCTELLLDGSDLPPHTRRDLEMVRTEAARAGQIVRNLLGFVHRGAGERAVHDVNAIVHKIAALRAYHLRQMGIELDVRCHPEPLPARISHDEIQQVLLNLILNAEHAIAGDGRGSRITLYTWRDAQGIAVQVADDGPGISPEVRGRIFEPFFTTRQVGEGTGLGLSISLGIAIAHGGRLEFAPSPEGGASFRLTLPPYEEIERPAAVAEMPPAQPAPNGPRALIVDDEEAMRSLLVRMLERRGFSVLQAADGDSALALLGNAPVDLVLCDAQLPKVSGTELFARASMRRPQLRGRFVLISEDGVPLDAAAARAGLPLLSKPFSAAQLDAMLERTTGRSTSPSGP